MHGADTVASCTKVPQGCATLWYCNHCNAVISIQSARAVDAAFCPACAEGPLDFCGSFGGFPGLQFCDA
jgi:hypothetical protein